MDEFTKCEQQNRDDIVFKVSCMHTNLSREFLFYAILFIDTRENRIATQ